ncbi:Galactokinase [Jeotgalibaca dankookensis]|uniref:Galactokinase n=1 Tax=Jeotgalibaca dankookensis TaxID=708126 RepID=A0A1S6IPZ8_9LACT|nr:mevalonate kinase [Jeotgalibaca dankookensis]AQS53631.1 Galactokinase [Jeotgalibaca dankookensis]
MKNEQIIGTSHGKIILMGEHSVVYGHPSIALPFPAVHMEATIKPANEATIIDCSYYSGIADDMPEVLQSLKTAIETALLSLDKENEKLMISVNSTIPPERGMGSSAAVAVAITRAIYHYYHQPLSHQRLLELVDVSEKIAHGNPSGLDAIMTSGDHPVFYRKGHPFVEFDLRLDGYLVVADTGVTGQTKAAVGSIASRLETNEKQKTKQQIEKLGLLAEKARTYLETNQPIALGQAMSEAHDLLSDLGVSSTELNRLVEAGKEAGALGAKLTGGGRGGCMIALAANKNAADKISQALLNSGAVKTWITYLNEEVKV